MIFRGRKGGNLRPPEGVLVGRYGAGDGGLWVVDRKSEMFYGKSELKHEFFYARASNHLLYLVFDYIAKFIPVRAGRR